MGYSSAISKDHPSPTAKEDPHLSSDNTPLRSYLIRYYVVLSQLSYRQDKRMDELNLFIDYHYKSIQSSEQGMSLLFTCPILTEESLSFLSTGSCKNAPAHYVISTR